MHAHIRRRCAEVVILRLLLLALADSIVFLTFPGVVQANAGIPGPLMIAAAPYVGNPLVWLATTTAVCIIVEGGIYAFLGLFHRPFAASAYANIWSLFAGIPLAAVGMVDPTLVVLPTVLSTLVEWFVLRRYLRFHPGPAQDTPRPVHPIFWPIVLANACTNGLLFVSLFFIAGRSL